MNDLVAETNSPEKLNSTKLPIIEKLNKRIEQNKPADLVMLDMDGTTYLPQKTPDGNWTKLGSDSNQQTNQILAEKGIPYAIVSARGDWDEKADNELNDLGFANKPDLVITGAGTVVYWRQNDGMLQKDQAFHEQQLAQKIALVNGQNQPDTQTNFLNTTIKSHLETHSLQNLPKDKFPKGIRASENRVYAVIDFKELTVDEIRQLSKQIHQDVRGIRVTFSTDLKAQHDQFFSGWMQIIPPIAGKDKASRYALTKISDKLNSTPRTEGEIKPKAHFFGDDQIDTWMLAMGSSPKDPYECQQYAVGNLTPIAEQKMTPVITSLEKPIAKQVAKKGFRQAHLSRINKPGPNAILQVVKNLT